MELSSEDVAELWRVQRTLLELTLRDDKWRLNLTVFTNMSYTDRYRWWYRAKAQARKGAPAMQTLLAKVIELRLTGR